MSELKTTFVKAEIGGDAATVFAMSVIGKSAPTTNDEAQKLIDAVKALTPDNTSQDIPF
jgi:hypothetical protein